MTVANRSATNINTEDAAFVQTRVRQGNPEKRVSKTLKNIILWLNLIIMVKMQSTAEYVLR